MSQGVVGEEGHMVDEGMENGGVKHAMVNNTHLMEHCDEQEAKDGENNEQVVAERSLQEA